jgi:hypothetical protein
VVEFEEARPHGAGYPSRAGESRHSRVPRLDTDHRGSPCTGAPAPCYRCPARHPQETRHRKRSKEKAFPGGARWDAGRSRGHALLPGRPHSARRAKGKPISIGFQVHRTGSAHLRALVRAHHDRRREAHERERAASPGGGRDRRGG